MEACIIKDGGHNIIDVANQPETGENDLSVENVPLLASESSTSMLPDEDDCDDDDDMTYDASKDEDCDDDDTPSEYAFDESKDDKEDCDEENERPLPYTTNSLSNTAAQVPTSPFATGGQGEARPTVTGTCYRIPVLLLHTYISYSLYHHYQRNYQSISRDASCQQQHRIRHCRKQWRHDDGSCIYILSWCHSICSCRIALKTVERRAFILFIHHLIIAFYGLHNKLFFANSTRMREK